MHWRTRVVGATSVDTEPCISIIFEGPKSAKYFFNCGEATTRMILQRKTGWTKGRALFLTGINTQRSAGVPGLLMSMSDSGTKALDIIGPEGLDHYIASTRGYCRRDALSVSTTECIPTLDTVPPLVYKDENISVHAVTIPHPSKITEEIRSPSSSSLKRKLSESNSDIEADPSELTPAGIRKSLITSTFPGLSSAPLEGAVVEAPRRNNAHINWALHRTQLPRAQRATSAVTYIGIGPIVRGKFDASKATALGVMGPSRGKLTKGETVLAKDGTVVTPDMCIGPSVPASAFIFIDCPSPEYIEGLIKSPNFDLNAHFGNVNLHLMVHRLGPDVLEDPRYVTWMNGFGENVHHLVASDDYSPNPVTFVSSAYTQIRLAELDSEIFRVPMYSSKPKRILADIPNLPLKTSLLETDQVTSMYPLAAPAISPVSTIVSDRFTPAVLEKERGGGLLPLSPSLVDAFETVKERVQAVRRKEQPGDDVIITPLGTGSALPSKYRNVSSTLVQIPLWGSILLDAGEGTWGQLSRQFGSDTGGDDVFTVLRDIKCIFISHLHGDHHIGLSKILSQRTKLSPPPKQPLYLIANPQTLQYLYEYDNLEDLGFSDKALGVRPIVSSSVQWIEGRSPDEAPVLRSTPKSKDLCNILGLTSINTVEVDHRGKHCYGIVLRHSDGWSMVFSGDTALCPRLARAGHGATLLIHEASMADEELELAEAKAHSTAGQAIQTGRLMEAQNVLLTHFSQRYPKMLQLTAPSIELIPEEAVTSVDIDVKIGPSVTSKPTTESAPTPRMYRPPPPASPGKPDPVVALAFDHASMSIGSMWKMEVYSSVIEQCFAETVEPDDEDEVGLEVDIVQKQKGKGKAEGPLEGAKRSEGNVRPLKKQKRAHA